MATNGKAPGGGDPNQGRGSLTPEERDALKQRASELGKRLDVVHARKAPPAGNNRARGNALGEAFKIVAELVVGVVVGGGIGWALDKALDKALGTRPWLLVLFLILGFAAGMSNVVRTARRMQAASEPMQRSAPSVPDDDDDGERRPGPQGGSGAGGGARPGSAKR